MEEKTIIKLYGTGSNVKICYYENLNDIEDGFYDDCSDFNVIFNNISVLANGQEITKSKGKYVNCYPFSEEVVNRFKLEPTSEHIVFRMADVDDWEFDFEFELPIGPKDFDPKKLQLIKSDYECREIPYAILADAILYDGKLYWTDDDYDYCMTSFPKIEYCLGDSFKNNYDKILKVLS